MCLIICTSYSLIHVFFFSFPSASSPIFINFDDYSVSYEYFYGSLKARGYVADDVMCAYAKLFNLDANDLGSSNSNVRKYSFSPFLTVSTTFPCTPPILFFTHSLLLLFLSFFSNLCIFYHQGKLIKDPAVFDKNSCVREISRINKEVNLETIDLVWFSNLFILHIKFNYHKTFFHISWYELYPFTSCVFFPKTDAFSSCEEQSLGTCLCELLV